MADGVVATGRFQLCESEQETKYMYICTYIHIYKYIYVCIFINIYISKKKNISYNRGQMSFMFILMRKAARMAAPRLSGVDCKD